MKRLLQQFKVNRRLIQMVKVENPFPHLRFRLRNLDRTNFYSLHLQFINQDFFMMFSEFVVLGYQFAAVPNLFAQ